MTIMKIHPQNRGGHSVAFLTFIAFWLSGCVSNVDTSESGTGVISAASSVETAPAMDYLEALERIKSLGAITIGGNWSFSQLRETPVVNETRMRLVFVDGYSFDCRYADTPNPKVDRKAFAQPPTRVTVMSGGTAINIWNDEDRSKSWAMAWRILATGGSQQSDGDKAAFAKLAQEYRASSPRPVLSEEVRMLKVQAARAVKDQDLWAAAKKFRQALVIAPWWPEGHYNLALISAELGLFKYAAQSMERYLQLVPDASDARAARDKIYEWRGMQ